MKGFTQVPNAFFEMVTRLTKHLETQVVLHVARMTYGFHRDDAELNVGSIARAIKRDKSNVKKILARMTARRILVKTAPGRIGFGPDWISAGGLNQPPQKVKSTPGRGVKSTPPKGLNQPPKGVKSTPPNDCKVLPHRDLQAPKYNLKENLNKEEGGSSGLSANIPETPSPGPVPADPPLNKLFREFNGGKRDEPTQAERAVLSQALKWNPLDYWQPFCRERLRRKKAGESVQEILKFFFESDFRAYDFADTEEAHSQKYGEKLKAMDKELERIKAKREEKAAGKLRTTFPQFRCLSCFHEFIAEVEIDNSPSMGISACSECGDPAYLITDPTWNYNKDYQQFKSSQRKKYHA